MSRDKELLALADEMMAARAECYRLGAQIPRSFARLWADRLRALTAGESNDGR